MARKMFPLLACLCLIAFFSTHALLAQDEVYGLINANDVDVRVGPDFAYPIVETLPRDASVEVVGRSGSLAGRYDGRQWLQIQYNDRTVWIIGRFVRMGRTFNEIPLVGLSLPRDRDRRVPDIFDLGTFICDSWQGGFSQSGNYMAGDAEMTFNYPLMNGAVNYSFVAVAPSGSQRTLDSQEASITVPVGRLNLEAGVYTWYIIPFWNDTTDPQRAQQLCVRRMGGTFEKPDTSGLPPTPTPTPTAVP